MDTHRDPPTVARRISIAVPREALLGSAPPAAAARSIHEELAATRGARAAARWRAQQEEWTALRAALGHRLGRGVEELTLSRAEEWRATREVRRPCERPDAHSIQPVCQCNES
jgi:hypothetical protein